MARLFSCTVLLAAVFFAALAGRASSSGQSMFQLAVEASNQGDTAEAVRIFRLLARDAPNDPLTLCNLGTALMRHGNGPAARPEWERVYSEALRIYLRALAINPALPDGLEGYALVKKNVHIRMDLSGGSAAEADAVIAMASEPADDSFVDASAGGLPTNSLGSFSDGGGEDDDDDDDEWDDDFDDHDNDNDARIGRPGTKHSGGAERDAMHAFLTQCGLSKYYDALYNYGIDDLDFLLEIEAFDMEYVSMSKVDQKTLLAAIAGGDTSGAAPAEEDGATSTTAVGSGGTVGMPATETPATLAAAGAQKGDAMHAFLSKCGLAKYYDVLYKYGIDDLDFLLEIEHFDMECVASLPPLQSSRAHAGRPSTHDRSRRFACARLSLASLTLARLPRAYPHACTRSRYVSMSAAEQKVLMEAIART